MKRLLNFFVKIILLPELLYIMILLGFVITDSLLGDSLFLYRYHHWGKAVFGRLMLTDWIAAQPFLYLGYCLFVLLARLIQLKIRSRFPGFILAGAATGAAMSTLLLRGLFLSHFLLFAVIFAVWSILYWAIAGKFVLFGRTKNVI